MFDVTGVRLATATTRQKPDVVGPDGGNDTFLGFTLASGGITGSNGQLSTSIAACQNNASYPNFFGTSAATLHVAGIAALMLPANSAATPTEIASALKASALPMGGAQGFDFTSGFGCSGAKVHIITKLTPVRPLWAVKFRLPAVAKPL